MKLYTGHYPGSTHDFTIFKSRSDLYSKMLEKSEEENKIRDNGY